MRTIVAMAAVLLSTGAARADDTARQFEAAVALFAPGAASVSDFIFGMPRTLMADLDGTWTMLPTDIAAAGDATGVIARSCARIPVAVAVESPYAFSATRQPGSDQEVRYDYTVVVGNVFAEHVDPKQLLTRLGLADLQGMETAIGSVLRNANGPVSLFRPSPDVLVIEPFYAPPEFLIRCPTQG